MFSDFGDSYRIYRACELVNWLVSEGSTYPAGKIVYEVGGGYEARFTAGALPGNFHCYLLPV